MLIFLTIVSVLLAVTNIAAAAYLIGLLARAKYSANVAVGLLTPPSKLAPPSAESPPPESLREIEELIVEEPPPLPEESCSIKLKLSTSAAARTNTSRKECTDAWICDDKIGLYAVFDGVGSEEDGAACRVAAKSVRRWITEYRSGEFKSPEMIENPHREGRRLRLALDHAHAKVHALQDEQQPTGTNTAKCSAVAALRAGNVLMIGWVGNTKLYRIRAGELSQITLDQANCLGSKTQPEPGMKELVLDTDGRYLLCNIGLTEAIGESRALEILTVAEEPESAAEKLVTEAANNNPEDDMTVVVLFAEEE